MGNLVISLRDLGIERKPGTKMGKTTTHFDIPDGQSFYFLREDVPQKVWLDRLHLAGSRVLVFVHGFADDAEKVIQRHLAIKRQLLSGITLVSFDWPAGNIIDPYIADKANATLSAPKLMTDCLNVLVAGKLFDAGNIHLFAHSMGGYVTETAFQGQSSIKINHVVMAAADVDQSNYGRNSTSLKNFLGKCTDLTAYWSTDDAALHDSERMNKYTPLGLKGYPDPDTPAGCSGVQCTTYYNKYVKYDGQEDTFSHIWYIRYEPTLPAHNDFFDDMNSRLPAPPLPTPAPPLPSRALGFVLRRPT
jgi:Alpha/beta hydrolase of unknown function (DUF900)